MFEHVLLKLMPSRYASTILLRKPYLKHGVGTACSRTIRNRVGVDFKWLIVRKREDSEMCE